MASQSNFRKVQRKEASDKMLALRERIITMDNDLAGCADAHGILDVDLLRKCAGMLLTGAYALHNTENK